MTLTIDCDECVMQHTEACEDCVVTFLCDRDPGETLVIEAREERVVHLLQRAGMIPALRHERRTG
jgi:hypothetical protein